MPIYEYKCERGHVTEDIVLDGSDPKPSLPCGRCDFDGARQFSLPRRMALSEGVVAENLSKQLRTSIKSRRDIDAWEEAHGATLRDHNDPALLQAHDYMMDQGRALDRAAREDGTDGHIKLGAAMEMSEKTSNSLSESKELVDAMSAMVTSSAAPTL